MTRTVLFSAAIAIATVATDARACSCVGPHLAYLSPTSAAPVPTNVHVRIEAVSTSTLRLLDVCSRDVTSRTEG